MSEKTKCCVIIPMYGKAEYTRKCVEMTRLNAGIPVDIVVVDDGSPEPYVDSSIQVIRLDKNSGYTNAVNQGIIWCNNRYEYVCLLNNDTEPKKDFLKIMVELADSDETIGIVSPARIENRSGIFFVELEQLDILRGFHRTILLKDLKEELIDCKAVAGNCYLIPTRVIAEIGLLDKSMTTFCTDTDYGFRVILAGYRIVITTKSLIRHHRSITIKEHNLDADSDMKKFLEKYSGYSLAKLLSSMPLDSEQKTYGKLVFEIEKR